MLKSLLKVIFYYVVIPFIASLISAICSLMGLYEIGMLIVPIMIGVLYFLCRKKLDLKFSTKVNGISFLVLLIIFTMMMILSSGNVEGNFMVNFGFFLFPFAPSLFVFVLMDQFLEIYIICIGSYLLAFILSAYFSRESVKKYRIWFVVSVICLFVNVYLYMNRPSIKYGGHGFDYMNGYSSTDFTDYMVYSKNSKLVTLDHKPSLIIENEKDMPVLDGAEACYPVYAAIAKAVYKDIDQIEKNYSPKNKSDYVGKIVTFSNTIFGFDRLVYGSKWNEQVDIFFGASPSKEQLEFAKENGVELEITAIGKEGFVFFVEEDNPVDNLTSEQVRAIYHGTITNWKEVGGKDQKIKAFQRPNNSGSQTRMIQFMGDVSLREPDTYEVVSAMEGVIHEVEQYANEDGAIGYTFRYFLEGLNQEKHVKMLSIDGIYPTIETIEDNSYPLTGYLNVITRKNDANPYVQKMIDFILSEDGQTIIRNTGYGGMNK